MVKGSVKVGDSEAQLSVACSHTPTFAPFAHRHPAISERDEWMVMSLKTQLRTVKVGTLLFGQSVF